ncbi:hypothetical protein [Phytomonospora endophytica]|uniref:Uncharacterized protein n=1 Tax=Phytomonospora endophytica TaxID=714109 RepID=A0A841FQI9_9ACTN|nr:hypothetical protein [Phytomonospora endophytica]MBB6038104.1 hypothetical protein [Phytomonospora endophytica]GIG67433.1 hypothetical protein Pen01_37280 [Phytomonospora endophytica]
MSLRLLGANPCVTLYDDGTAVAYASLWRSDWSEQGGTGHVIVFGRPGRIRVLGADRDLSVWLAESFNRHLKGVNGAIPWSEPEYTVAPVEWDLDLSTGVRAAADDVEVEITGPFDRMLTRDDAYDLGGTTNVLSTVWMPCRAGTIRVGGELVPGAPEVDLEAPMSSAFIAEAEVWGWTTGERGPAATTPGVS